MASPRDADVMPAEDEFWVRIYGYCSNYWR